ncbi:MAG: hypothetical protein PVJ39_01330 [Gammaproteobacteria bacterium]|jgi:hypothetical protein
MNEQVFQLTLSQLAILVFAAIAMYAPTSIIVLAIIGVSTTLSYSLASSLALAQKLEQADHADIDEAQPAQTAILGTHIGGILCYGIMLSLLFRNLFL